MLDNVKSEDDVSAIFSDQIKFVDVAEVGEDGFDVGGWWGDPYSVTLVLLTSFRVT